MDIEEKGKIILALSLPNTPVHQHSITPYVRQRIILPIKPDYLNKVNNIDTLSCRHR